MGNGNDDVINLCPEMNLIWDQNFTLLGIDFNANLDNMDKNFDSKLKDIENVISKWQYRILSPIGRCCIAKTLLLSKLSNLAIVLPCLKPSMLKKIEDLIFRFIWKGPDKVARETAKLHILQGGLSMPDIKSSWMSYKMAWFRRLYNSNAKWTDIFNLLINKVHNNYSLSNFFTLGLNDYDVLGKKTDSSFWSECIKTIKPFMLELVKQYPEKLLVTVLWGSVFFTQNDRPLRTKLYPSLAGKILCPIDIIDANMNEIRFKEFNEICASYGNINEDEYISLKVAISQTFMKNKFNLADMDKSNLSMPYAPSFIQLINLSLKGCSKWTRLLKKKYTNQNIVSFEQKWDLALGAKQGVNFWNRCYRGVYSLTFNSKIKWLHYQIIRGSLKTNRIVSKFKTEVQKECTFCNSDTETILHLFWECRVAKAFIDNCIEFARCEHPIFYSQLARKDFIFGFNEDICSPKNYFALHVKYFLWIERCKKNVPSINFFKSWFTREMRIDRYNTDEKRLNFLSTVLENDDSDSFVFI